MYPLIVKSWRFKFNESVVNKSITLINKFSSDHIHLNVTSVKVNSR